MITIPEYARLSLQQLIAHVFDHRHSYVPSIYYSELASRIGYFTSDGKAMSFAMGHVLSEMGKLFSDIESDWGEPIPHINCLVVSKSGPSKGLPEDGIEEFWPGYSEMTPVEKKNKVRLEYQRILAFGSRWNEVLKALNLPPIKVDSSQVSYGTGGESERHLLLKEYIRNNPQIVSHKEYPRSFIEYTLPSLDTIDVFFKSADACLAVEVKSSVSDNYPSDYERGIFQIVKYRSLLESMSRVGEYDIPSEIEAVLVLESQLPEKYSHLAKELDIRVIENVEVKSS